MFKDAFKISKITIIAFAIIFISSFTARSEEYPEFTGNYIKKGGEWIELPNLKLDLMRLSNNNNNPITYTGLFDPKKYKKVLVKVEDNKPRILLYSGRQQADPSNTALVELAKLPYNNMTVREINKTDYSRRSVNYSNESVSTEMWVFKREVSLRYKPIDGKIGAFMYQPVEPLTDGIYMIDSGFPKNGKHDKLDTEIVQGEAGSLLKAGQYGKLGGLTFIVGNVELDNPAKLTNNSGESARPKGTSENNPQNTTNNLNEAVENLLNGILK